MIRRTTLPETLRISEPRALDSETIDCYAYHMRKKIIVLVTSIFLVTGTLVACGSHQPACAEDTVLYKSSGSSSGGSKSGGASKPSSGSKTPSAPSGNKPATGSGATGKSKTAQQQEASKMSKPNVKPSVENTNKAKSEAPKTITRGGNYYSSVTGNTYVFHSSSYYLRPGYVWDIYDPYNPYNYWYYPTSPFYGTPYRVAGSCGGEAKEVKAESANNINITIDSDGKVVSGEDKNQKDPLITESVEADNAPPTSEG